MASSEDQPLTMDRSSRLTRGKRMTKLLDEEIEEDELFWNQDALQEEANDDNYEEEHEVPDEFDSDFEDDEPEQDDEVEVPVEDRMRDKKKLIFPGKQDSKKKNKKAFSKLKEISKAEKSPQEKVVAHTENQDATDAFDGERAVRKSTRTSVIVRQAERDAIRAASQATIKPSKRKKEGEEKRMTQEEMLLEAAQTEIMNLRNLERVLAREEEVKKKAVVHKAVYEGPQVRFMSKNGISSLEFMKGSSFKSELCTASAPYPQKSFCVVTGLPARYRDPNTGLPYATVEAFKIIRERAISFLEKKDPRLAALAELCVHTPGYLSTLHSADTDQLCLAMVLKGRRFNASKCASTTDCT